jgi:outer membrane protein insertion porin family
MAPIPRQRLRNLMTSTESNFLSFIKTSDVYDPDRITSDLELVRRFYLKNGYADFQVVGNTARFDEAQGGWVIDITVDEGPQYKVGNVSVDSRLRDVDPTRCSAYVVDLGWRHLQCRVR